MLITGATLADGRVRDVRIKDGRIAAVETDLDPAGADRVVDAEGAHLLPGAIDVHVHFRQPGGAHKETWATGSKSAAAGGVTTVVDQPNTDPPTIDAEAVTAKEQLAADSLVDYGINGGVTPEWDPDGLLNAPILALGEVFLADSTGEMGIDADRFAAATAAAAERGRVVCVPDGRGGGDGRRTRALGRRNYRIAAARRTHLDAGRRRRGRRGGRKRGRGDLRGDASPPLFVPSGR